VSDNEHPAKYWLGIVTAVISAVVVVGGSLWAGAEWVDTRYQHASKAKEESEQVDAKLRLHEQAREREHALTLRTLEFNRVNGELGRMTTRSQTLQDRVDDLAARPQPRPQHEAIALRRALAELDNVNRNIRTHERQLNELRAGVR